MYKAFFKELSWKSIDALAETYLSDESLDDDLPLIANEGIGERSYRQARKNVFGHEYNSTGLQDPILGF
jgi:hypothetical protein